MAGAGPDTKKALRQYYKCPCNKKEGNDKSLGYVLDKDDRWKLGEMMQEQVKKLTGTKPKGCAWWSIQKDPFVAEVLHIFNLAKDYPNVFNESLPNCVYQGVIIYRGAHQRAQNWWVDYDIKKREEKERLDKAKSKPSAPRRRF